VGPLLGLQQRFARSHGWIAVFGLGATYGLAGFCTGPILGSVLTIAAAGGQAVHGVVLLAIYALGMAVPLFVLALLWQRLNLGSRRWLRGREYAVGPLRLHTTSTISGLLFVGIGVLFLVFNGTATLGLLGLAPSARQQLAAQNRVNSFSSHVPDIALLAVLAVLVLSFAFLRTRRQRRTNKS
jgi:thiol:disulfide interchange protein